LLAIVLIAPTRAEPQKEAKGASTSTDSSKKEPVHLVVKSDAEARKIFTYIPYPVPPTGLQSPSVNGKYQLTVAPQGEVTQIKILKTMGPIMDVTALKAFIRWKAQPGPLRLVDVAWGLTMMQAPIRSVGSHIPRKDSMAR
jgi:Gram-negative bacterial TonB protein C-terminal